MCPRWWKPLDTKWFGYKFRSISMLCYIWQNLFVIFRPPRNHNAYSLRSVSADNNLLQNCCPQSTVSANIINLSGRPGHSCRKKQITRSIVHPDSGQGTFQLMTLGFQAGYFWGKQFLKEENHNGQSAGETAVIKGAAFCGQDGDMMNHEKYLLIVGNKNSQFFYFIGKSVL